MSLSDLTLCTRTDRRSSSGAIIHQDVSQILLIVILWISLARKGLGNQPGTKGCSKLEMTCRARSPEGRIVCKSIQNTSLTSPDTNYSQIDQVKGPNLVQLNSREVIFENDLNPVLKKSLKIKISKNLGSTRPKIGTQNRSKVSGVAAFIG